jgi:hypothetical protein
MPADAFSAVQAFENRLITFFKRREPASLRDARNNIKPDKLPTGFGAFSTACNNLIKTGVLVPAGDSNRVGTVRYKLDPSYKA